ncbi:hypothetical protein SDC9_196426 [bioreactor metagenome]|uniref:Uncharacterized protein n=1 Tax=bioreactor metagenome TaxID=1076179 RepID=A0A645IKH3_9ZZZZ
MLARQAAQPHQGSPGLGRDHLALQRDLGKLAAKVDHQALKAFIRHQEVGPVTDDQRGNTMLPGSRERRGHFLRVARLHHQAGRAAHLDRRIFGQNTPAYQGIPRQNLFKALQPGLVHIVLRMIRVIISQLSPRGMRIWNNNTLFIQIAGAGRRRSPAGQRRSFRPGEHRR